ncbi:hypothetical protein [Nocardia sp. NPDC003183]
MITRHMPRWVVCSIVAEPTGARIQVIAVNTDTCETDGSTTTGITTRLATPIIAWQANPNSPSIRCTCSAEVTVIAIRPHRMTIRA